MCRLCDNGFDFRKIIITKLLDGYGIGFRSNLNKWNKDNIFKYCPECGRKLSIKDFESNKKEGELDEN